MKLLGIAVGNYRNVITNADCVDLRKRYGPDMEAF